MCIRDRAEVARLKDHYITICAWTKKIKEGDHDWVSPEEFLERHFDLTVTHGVSDDMRSDLMGELDQILERSQKDGAAA